MNKKPYVDKKPKTLNRGGMFWEDFGDCTCGHGKVHHTQDMDKIWRKCTLCECTLFKDKEDPDE